MKKSIFNVWLVGVVLLAAGCAQMDNQESDAVDPSSFDDIGVVFKDLQGGYYRQGGFVATKALSQLKSGSLRSDVLGALGDPISGKGNDDWWFYNINLPLGDSDDYLVCQYRVAFNSLDQVSEIMWRRPQCENIFQKLSEPEIRTLTLSSDVLFAFDSAVVTPKGMDELRTVAAVAQNKLHLDGIEVVGHTDRLGSYEYNVTLSNQRAAAVKDFLASAGISGYKIVASGRGSSEPVVDCPGNKITTALKKCLQPNRRVEIIIRGESGEEIQLN